jgi:hypothetical protein
LRGVIGPEDIMARWFSASLIALVSLLSVRPAAAADHYVSTLGDDDSNPGSVGLPFKTLYKACHTAAAGDIVDVRGGTYDGAAVPGVGVLDNCGGSPGAPISFVGYSGSVTFTNYVTLRSWQPTGTRSVYKPITCIRRAPS